MRNLYSPLEPYATCYLPVSGGHEIYVEQSGNPDGIPVLFLHGGPGSGAKPHHRRYFDPARYRVVILDQRACGRSRPRGRLQHNNTQELLADLEAIRENLGIRRWLLFGGSWGAALALAYGERQPNRITGMILRGCFLARREDLDWYLVHGPPHLFPDAWQELLSGVPPAERDQPVPYLFRMVTGRNRKETLRAARLWDTWTGRLVSYCLPPPSAPAYQEDTEKETPDSAVRRVGIELHYALNHYFLEPNQLLRDLKRLPRVPVTIIHGRRDITCTLSASWELHHALPGSELLILESAGHLAGGAEMLEALLNTTDRYARMSL